MFEFCVRPRSPRAAFFTLMAAFVMAGLADIPVAAAQAQAGDETVTSADVPDAEVEQFARSLEDVLVIQNRLKEELAATQDRDEAQRLQQQANTEMLQAVEAYGLNPERYNVIARSLGEDQELNQRIQEKRQEIQQESQSD